MRRRSAREPSRSPSRARKAKREKSNPPPQSSSSPPRARERASAFVAEPPRSPLKRIHQSIRRTLPRVVAIYAPKVPIVSSAFLLTLWVLCAPTLSRMYHALHTEGVVVSDVASTAFDVGRFVVSWNRDDQTLSAQYKTSRWCIMRECVTEAWSTVPGVPFVRVGSGPIHVHQLIAGHFRITLAKNLRTSIQTIDDIAYDAIGKRVTIRGKLIKEDAKIDRWMSKLGDFGAKLRESMAKREVYKAQAKLVAAYEFVLASDGDGDRLRFEINWDDRVPGVLRASRRRIVGLNQLEFVYAMDADERVYGLGEQFSSYDHRGRRVPIITGEQGIGRGRQPMSFALNSAFPGSAGSWHTTYSAIPHYVTHKARSVFLTNYTYSEFDFSDEDRAVIHIAAPTGFVTGQIIGASSIPAVLEAYTEFVGRMNPLPEWALDGVVLGMTGGQTKVRSVYKILSDANVKIAGLWLQDWGGVRNTSIGIERVWWNWQLDETHYEDWDALREDVGRQGTQLMTYINPFLMESVSEKGALYRHAEQNNYMVRNVRDEVYKLGSEPGVTFGLLDLSNPGCVQWIEDVIVDMLEKTKAMAWMADFGEYLPFDAKLHSGELPLEVHNRYPEDWAEVNRRALRRAGLEDKAFFWSRSASLKSPTYTPLFWLGDQLVSWDGQDGIKSAVMALLQSGLSGLTLQHSDIGGYTATPGRVRTPELLMRWMELSAFSDAVYRTHQGNRPHHNAQPWNTPELVAHLKTCVDIHVALKPYKLELMREAQTNGLPLTRAMLIYYPYDVVASNLATQFLIGRDILVAPVLDKKTAHVHVYLPPGDVWLDAWTTQQAPVQPDSQSSEDGGRGVWVTVDAPLGWPVVFIRKAAGKTAISASGALRDLAMARGGVPAAKRRVRPMDPVDRIVLGLT